MSFYLRSILFDSQNNASSYRGDGDGWFTSLDEIIEEAINICHDAFNDFDLDNFVVEVDVVNNITNEVISMSTDPNSENFYVTAMTVY